MKDSNRHLQFSAGLFFVFKKYGFSGLKALVLHGALRLDQCPYLFKR